MGEFPEFSASEMQLVARVLRRVKPAGIQVEHLTPFEEAASVRSTPTFRYRPLTKGI